MTHTTALTRHNLYIDGAWVEAEDGRYSEVIEPATGLPMAQVAQATRADVDRAVAAARRAFDHGPWPHVPPPERARILHTIADAIEEHTEELCELEARNSGSTLRKTSFVDIPLGVDNMRVMAELARRHPYEPLPWNDMPALSWSFVWREPIGVCAQIVPWNFPYLMAIWKIAPALATGNTVLLKPASLTPLSAIRLVEIIHETGVLPRGVLNLVTGSGRVVGEGLAAHPQVDKVAFTGSTEVGKRVMELASGTIKKVSLELGGKSPSIILPDADLDMAIDGVLFGAFLHNGQICLAGTRCFVPRMMHDHILDRLVTRMQGLKLGDPLDLTTDLGPLVDLNQRETVEHYIALGLEEGATLACGGKRPDDAQLAARPYIQPTIFTNVRNNMRIAQEEIFGPVLAVIPYDTLGDAIKMANDTLYGLSASIWSRDIPQAIDVARRIHAGTVWINDHHLVNANAPFGGYKQSGIGRELGLYGLNDYTQPKHIHVDLTTRRENKIWWDTLLTTGE